MGNINQLQHRKAEMAKQHEVEPLRISFINALFLIMDEMIWASDTRSPGAIPKNLKALRGKWETAYSPQETE